jgi:hypothetical protein
VTLGQAGQVAARCLCLSVSALRNGRAASAPRPGRERLRRAELCGKRAGGHPDGRRAGSAGSERAAGAPPRAACVPGPAAAQPRTDGRRSPRPPPPGRSRRPPPPPGAREPSRAPPPPPTSQRCVPYRDPRPGRRARDTQAVPGAPRPRVRARSGRPHRSRGRLGHGPALSGPRPASRRRRRRRLRRRCLRRRARLHAGPAAGSSWQAARPGPAFPAGAARPSGPGLLGARGAGGRAGAGPGRRRRRRRRSGARGCAGDPAGCAPAASWDPALSSGPRPARRPSAAAAATPGSGPGPGCELRCRPGASSAGELHSSCHVDTNCILGGMSLSGRLKRNTPRLVGGCRNPDSSIYSR